jgi:hypothetical protein
MATSPMNEVVRRLRAAALRYDTAERTDAQLLADYLAGHDEVALTVLVRRHGPMMNALAVCQPLHRHRDLIFGLSFPFVSLHNCFH